MKVRYQRRVRKSSLELHQEFLRHRSRRKHVTDSIIGAAQVRDAMLAKELDTPLALTSAHSPYSRKTEPEPVV